MTDREKVINEIEDALSGNLTKAGHIYGLSLVGLKDKALTDALALLKEQEPIPCGEKIKAGDVVLDFYECGYCKNAIRKPWRYCPFCGKAVKWE